MSRIFTHSLAAFAAVALALTSIGTVVSVPTVHAASIELPELA